MISKPDCEACLKLLQEYLLGSVDPKEEDLIAVVESLAWCDSPKVKDTLFKIIISESELDYLREEAAESLGAIWAESEIDYDYLVQIPTQYIAEICTDFNHFGQSIDADKLGNRVQDFQKYLS